MLAPFAVLFLTASCNDQDDAIAAGTPQLELRAAIASAQTANAVAAVDGRIASITVREGSLVKPGTVVATLVNLTMERDLAFARAQVAIAEQRLRNASRPAVRSMSAGDNAARERAAAQILKNRESKRNRYRQLYETRDVSKQELEDAENEYAAALRDWLAERERATVTIAQTDTGLLKLELERARSDEAFAADRKSMLTIVAPIGGIVTRVNARVGDSVFPRDPIVEIANNATAEVRAPIAPELLRYVRTGKPLEVKVFTVPPRRFSAPVRAIVPGANGATLVVELPNPDGVLQAGQQAVITVK